ncbi:MAG: MOSC domain-containing protein [Raineya sp.]|jgi:hypothetical protein|nr:MOSC domain-containing protein [Raineya sp.]
MKGDYLISELYIYPIKSFAGIQLMEAEITDRGFLYDRRWMLVDNNGRFLSQREYSELCFFQPVIKKDGLEVYHKKYPSQSIFVPFQYQSENQSVAIWDDICQGNIVSEIINQFFSDLLKQEVKLVYMTENSQRLINTKYAKNGELTSFSDGYPFLMIGQGSLDDLNAKTSEFIPMNRFRPNIVFTGGDAFEEDTWKNFSINNIHFTCAKPCARCVVTTINQDTGTKGKEPLVTLNQYRKQNNKILFGQNIIHHGLGSIKVGDKLIVQ